MQKTSEQYAAWHQQLLAEMPATLAKAAVANKLPKKPAAPLTLPSESLRRGRSQGKAPIPPPPSKKAGKAPAASAPAAVPPPTRGLAKVISILTNEDHSAWQERVRVLGVPLRATLQEAAEAGKLGAALGALGRAMAATMNAAEAQVKLATLALVLDLADVYGAQITPLPLARGDSVSPTVLHALVKATAFKASAGVREAAREAAEVLLAAGPTLDALKIVSEHGHHPDATIRATAAILLRVLIGRLPAEALARALSRVQASLGELLVSKSANNETSYLTSEALVALKRAGFGDAAHAVVDALDKGPMRKRVMEQLAAAAEDDETWLESELPPSLAQP